MCAPHVRLVPEHRSFFSVYILRRFHHKHILKKTGPDPTQGTDFDATKSPTHTFIRYCHGSRRITTVLKLNVSLFYWSNRFLDQILPSSYIYYLLFVIYMEHGPNVLVTDNSGSQTSLALE